MEAILANIVKAQVGQVVAELHEMKTKIIQIRKCMDDNSEAIGNLKSCMESELTEMKTCLETTCSHNKTAMNSMISQRLGNLVSAMNDAISLEPVFSFNPGESIEELGLEEIGKGVTVSAGQPKIHPHPYAANYPKKITSTPLSVKKIAPNSKVTLSPGVSEPPNKKGRYSASSAPSLGTDDYTDSEDEMLYSDDCPDEIEDGTYIHVYKNSGGRKPNCSTCNTPAQWITDGTGQCGFYACKKCRMRYHKFISKTDRRKRNVQQWWSWSH